MQIFIYVHMYEIYFKKDVQQNFLTGDMLNLKHF